MSLRATITKVRNQGWALVDQELELGLRSLAMPVRRESHGQLTVVAALNVSMHTSKGSVEASRREMLPHRRAAADAIEKDLQQAH